MGLPDDCTIPVAATMITGIAQARSARCPVLYRPQGPTLLGSGRYRQLQLDCGAVWVTGHGAGGLESVCAQGPRIECGIQRFLWRHGA